jgi:UPF0716 protein FxsA
MPFALLIVLFIVVPIAELYVILQVGDAIGAVWTILLLAADSVLGSVLMKSQGRSVWRRFNAALAESRAPTREVFDGVLVIFGGAFLITPGFITDVIGVFLLVPPTRALVRRAAARRLLGAGAIRVARAAGRGRGRDRAPEQWDVEGTATEYDREAPRLRP